MIVGIYLSNYRTSYNYSITDFFLCFMGLCGFKWQVQHSKHMRGYVVSIVLLAIKKDRFKEPANLPTPIRELGGDLEKVPTLYISTMGEKNLTLFFPHCSV